MPFGDLPDRLGADMSLAEQHDWLAARVSRRTALKGLVVAGTAAASPMLWQQPARAAGARVLGRLLVPGVEPSREVTVAVAVSGSFRSGRVEVAGRPGGASEALDVQMVRGSGVRYARATLRGLEPDTEYSYRVLLDGGSASTGRLRTAPSGPAPFRFTAFGDQGVGDDSSGMLRRVAALRPALHLVAGDISYANQNGRGRPSDMFRPRLWDAWLAQIDRVASSVPFLCALGNHEMESGFGLHGYAGVLARVPLPGTSPLSCPASWVVQHGTVGFIGLDSNDVSHELPANRGYTAGAQASWLRSTLAALRSPRSDVEFIVAVMHHTPYGTNEAHGSEGGVREEWVPLFDRYAVDLVVSAHNHCYERTLPMRQGHAISFDADRVDSTSGTTYVTAGCGGAIATPEFIPEGLTRVSTAEGMVPESVDWALPVKTGQRAVLVADVRPGAKRGSTSTMVLRAVDRSGRTLDSLVLSRPAKAWTESAAPAPPPPPTSSRTGVVVLGSAAAAAVAAAAAGGVALRRRAQASRPVEPATPLPASTVRIRPLVERPHAGPPTDQSRPEGS
jgi:Calcineurin-like phosphoesterase